MAGHLPRLFLPHRVTSLTVVLLLDLTAPCRQTAIPIPARFRFPCQFPPFHRCIISSPLPLLDLNLPLLCIIILPLYPRSQDQMVLALTCLRRLRPVWATPIWMDLVNCLSFRTDMDSQMLTVLTLCIGMVTVIAAVACPAVDRSLAGSHHAFSSLQDGARMGMIVDSRMSCLTTQDQVTHTVTFLPGVGLHDLEAICMVMVSQPWSKKWET